MVTMIELWPVQWHTARSTRVSREATGQKEGGGGSGLTKSVDF